MDFSEIMNIILSGGLVGTAADHRVIACYGEESESGSDEGRGRCGGCARG